ncbi:MAG: NAD(P)H-quinone oxidoreductase [Polyangia bacterium]
MRAVIITEVGGPEVLRLVERDKPEPARGEVRVRVHAAALNRADLQQRRGYYAAPADSPQDIPGLEYAGEVDALGPDVTGLSVGDRVFGLVGGGAYAEYIVTHARALARIPVHLSYEDAAALPEGCITSYDAMYSQARLRGGETVLIHAAGSGVGTLAVQIAHALGAVTIGTARTADKLERAKKLGLTHGVVATDGKFADAVKQHAPDGVSVILDLVGGAYVEEGLRCIQVGGRLVEVGLTAGVRATLELALLLHRRATIIGTVIRARPLEEKIAVHRTFEREVVPLITRGAVKAVIDEVVPLADTAKAHARMESNDTFGKIVLRM